MNSKDLGTLVEHQCIVSMLELGHHVSIPVGESMPYDFILDFHGKLFKIQCKHASVAKDGKSFTISLEKNVSTRTQIRTTRYKSDEVDYFCTYLNKVCYLIPFEHLGSKTLRLAVSNNLQLSHVCWAVEYEADYVLGKLLNPDLLPRIDMNAVLQESRELPKDPKNSQYGTHWITNGSVNKKIRDVDKIPPGFRLGRTMNLS